MIHTEELTKAGIDYQAGLKRFMNDAELYEAVLTAFADENILERAQAAYDANDRALLLTVVHEAKGSGGNAGLDELYAEASTLVSLLRSPSYTDDELVTAYRQFKAAYRKATFGIQAALA